MKKNSSDKPEQVAAELGGILGYLIVTALITIVLVGLIGGLTLMLALGALGVSVGFFKAAIAAIFFAGLHKVITLDKEIMTGISPHVS